jgi:mitogen-activated protein kinase 1/3/mitogen-activated protein kinase 6
MRARCSTGEVRIADFGSARCLGKKSDAKSDLLPVSTYMVTRPYRAPELCVGNELYDEKIDVWSFGCLVAEVSASVG